jgi:hypothetical protein
VDSEDKAHNNDGQFTFTSVDSSIDCEIHAEKRKSVSQKVRISSSDKRREIVVKLRLVERNEK